MRYHKIESQKKKKNGNKFLNETAMDSMLQISYSRSAKLNETAMILTIFSHFEKILSQSFIDKTVMSVFNLTNTG